MKPKRNYLQHLLLVLGLVSIMYLPAYIRAQDDDNQDERGTVQRSDRNGEDGASRRRPSWRQNSNGERPQRGDRQAFDPAQMMTRRLDRMKEEMGANDDEWTILKPLIEKVYQKQMEERRYRVGGRSWGRGNTEEIKEVKELREALDNEKTSPEELKEKLDAFRKVRDKAGKELQAAKEELRKVLTVRQEAKLVADGLLE